MKIKNHNNPFLLFLIETPIYQFEFRIVIIGCNKDTSSIRIHSHLTLSKFLDCWSMEAVTDSLDIHHIWNFEEKYLSHSMLTHIEKVKSVHFSQGAYLQLPLWSLNSANISFARNTFLFKKKSRCNVKQTCWYILSYFDVQETSLILF